MAGFVPYLVDGRWAKDGEFGVIESGQVERYARLAAEERVRQLSEVVEAAREIATRIEQDFLYCPICEHVHNALDGSHEPLCPFAALARLQVDSEPTTCARCGEPTKVAWDSGFVHACDPYRVPPEPTSEPHTLVKDAFFLRVNGERPPGAPHDNPEAETWREWDVRAERYLQSTARPTPTPVEGDD